MLPVNYSGVLKKLNLDTSSIFFIGVFQDVSVHPKYKNAIPDFVITRDVQDGT